MPPRLTTSPPRGGPGSRTTERREGDNGYDQHGLTNPLLPNPATPDGSWEAVDSGPYRGLRGRGLVSLGGAERPRPGGPLPLGRSPRGAEPAGLLSRGRSP